jgi:hypothetical protein
VYHYAGKRLASSCVVKVWNITLTLCVQVLVIARAKADAIVRKLKETNSYLRPGYLVTCDQVRPIDAQTDCHPSATEQVGMAVGGGVVTSTSLAAFAHAGIRLPAWTDPKQGAVQCCLNKVPRASHTWPTL